MICKHFKVILISFLFVSSFEGKAATIIQRDNVAQSRADKYPNLVNLYRPNYILPFYKTHVPYDTIYENNTPDNQAIEDAEFKAQLSFLIPIVRHVIDRKPISFNFAYTQLMYWQLYTRSAYFRETNYEPELFLEGTFNKHTAMQFGVNHQSNGKGGDLERSWNRLYLEGSLSGKNWLMTLRGWTLLAKSESSDLHNPDITHFLGYENLLLAYNIKKLALSAELQNIESGLKRGFVQLGVSYPLFKQFSIYGQFFNGYGQSLIEYNHKSTSFGIGIILNDWAWA